MLTVKLHFLYYKMALAAPAGLKNKWVAVKTS